MDKHTTIEAFPEAKSVARKPRQAQKWWQLGGKDAAFVSVDDDHEDGFVSSSEEDLVKNTDNVFVAPEAQELYKPVEGFEGAHRFDPTATWSAEEEKKLVRRV